MIEFIIHVTIFHYSTDSAGGSIGFSVVGTGGSGSQRPVIVLPLVPSGHLLAGVSTT